MSKTNYSLKKINVLPLLEALNKYRKRAFNKTKKEKIYFLLHLFTNNIYAIQPNALPNPVDVPNKPNCLSFIFKSFFICFDADDNIPDELFTAISSLTNIINKIKRNVFDNSISCSFSFL